MPITEENLVRVLLKEQPRLLAFLQAIVRRDAVVEDLFQDLSLRAVRNRESIENEEHFVRWLYRSARNRAIDELRKSQVPSLDGRSLDLLEAEWSTPSRFEASDRADALAQCVEQLQPAAKQLIELRYDDGLSGEQIAERVSRKPSAVYMQLSRVRKALHDCIQQRLGHGRGSESGGLA
jgi:RNA polymerase sigma-70 factor (ECF subfamily)